MLGAGGSSPRATSSLPSARLLLSANQTWRRTMRRSPILALTGFLILGLAVATAQPSKYQFGDVFVSVGNSTVLEFSPTGVLVQTLNDASGSAFTTGSGFDSGGNFYVTNFSVGS